jgi:hypothetical protein
MENNERRGSAGCVRILWAGLAVLLCATPLFAYLIVTGEADVYADNPDIYDGLLAMPGSTVNIYSGEIGDGAATGITVSAGADVTVHGTDFALENVSGTAAFDDPENPTQIIPESGWLGILTGTYGEEQGSGPINLFFQSDDPITLVNTGGAGPTPIDIDIKPGSCPNPINPGSNGLIPVVIFTTDIFDAADVDPGTVTLNGAEVAVRGKSEKLMAHLEDVDGDGDDDLVLQVDTQSDGVGWEEGPVDLIGKTWDEEDIKGTDDVVIVPAN